MANDNAITRLLYAILSQKCLKDIDWNKVASNPILRAEITNGHAARMRYSRFKKQMEGTIPSSSPSSTPAPRRARVQKNTTNAKSKEKTKGEKNSELETGSSSGGHAAGGVHVRVKAEPGDHLSRSPSSPGTADSDSQSHLFSRSMTAATSTPSQSMLAPTTSSSFHSSFVKSEFGLGMDAELETETGSVPQTPGPASHSQCVGHDHTPAGSFGPGMKMSESFGMEMGMGMGGEDLMIGGGSFESGGGGGSGLFGEIGMGGRRHQLSHSQSNLHHGHQYPPSYAQASPFNAQAPQRHQHPSFYQPHNRSFPPPSSMPMSVAPTNNGFNSPSPLTAQAHNQTITDFNHLFTASLMQPQIQPQIQPPSQIPPQQQQQNRGHLSPSLTQTHEHETPSLNDTATTLGEVLGGAASVKQEPTWDEEYI